MDGDGDGPSRQFFFGAGGTNWQERSVCAAEPLSATPSTELQSKYETNLE